jgi:hypothetical protein
MIEQLFDIFDLEDSERYEEAFDSYRKIYSRNSSNYEIWKHYYFLLWDLIEDGSSDFQTRINLRQLLSDMLKDGQEKFNELADFNFIAGYTISIFPYEYGDYEDLEKIGIQMLNKATKLEPDNVIYKMCYLGSVSNLDSKADMEIVDKAAPLVLKTFEGKGLLNKYFRQVLYRKEKKANR